MDLPQILQKMQIREGLTSSDSCSVIFVLTHICERFKAKEERVLILEDTAEFFALAPLNWLFPQVNTDVREAYLALLSSFTAYASLLVCDTDSGTLPAKSYEDITTKAQAVSTALLALCVRMQTAENQNNPSVKSLSQALAPSLCLFSITHLQEQPWTSAASRNCALQLLASVARMTGSRSVQELLSGDEDRKGVFGPILHILQPELTK